MLYQFQSLDSQRALPLQVLMIGLNHLQPPIHRPAGVPYFQWFFCVKGQGKLISGDVRAVISPGQGFLICADEPHSYQPVSNDWTLHIVAFQGNSCANILKALQISETGVYQFSNSAIFEKHILQFFWLHQNRSADRSAAASKECYDFLVDISLCALYSYSQLSQDYKDNHLVSVISTYVDKHFAEPISLNDLAELLSLSKEYICTKFKAATGQTIMCFVLDVRLGRSRQFLAQYPEKKVAEIASMCGFESPSYFGKIFKREAGMTPEQYRKNL